MFRSGGEVRLDEPFGEVSVYGLKLVAVTDYDIHAVTCAASLIADDADFTVERGADGVADVELQVNAFVQRRRYP